MSVTSASLPLIQLMKPWLEMALGRVPSAGSLAKAIRYTLGRWPALTCFLDDEPYRTQQRPGRTHQDIGHCARNGRLPTRGRVRGGRRLGDRFAGPASELAAYLKPTYPPSFPPSCWRCAVHVVAELAIGQALAHQLNRVPIHPFPHSYIA
jgi:hypothetical protein